MMNIEESMQRWKEIVEKIQRLRYITSNGDIQREARRRRWRQTKDESGGGRGVDDRVE